MKHLCKFAAAALVLVFAVLCAAGALALEAPQTLTVTNLRGAIRVKWDSVSGAKKYEVWVKEGKGEAYKFETTESTKTTFGDVAAFKKFTFWIKAVNGDDKSEAGTKKAIYYVPPVRVTNVVLQGKGKIQAHCSQQDKATGYKIQASKYSNFKDLQGKKFENGDSATFTFKRDDLVYIRACAYYTVDGKTYQSAWSKSQTVVKVK